MLDAAWSWMVANGNWVATAFGLPLLLFLLKPVRDAFTAWLVGSLRWLGAFMASIPNHLAIRNHALGNRPLWSFRQPGTVNLSNAPPTLTIMNFKGGVGKTTLAANLAAALAAHRGLRVLLVDLDYQGSLSELLRPVAATADGINLVGKLLSAPTNKETVEAMTVPAADLPGVRLMTADYDLTDVEDNQLLRWLLREPTGGDVRSKLARLLTRQASGARDNFDIVIMDAPPRLSLAAANALRASRYVIIPTKLQPLSVLPVAKMVAYLRTFASRVGGGFRIAGVVCSMTAGEEAEGTEVAALAQITSTLAGVEGGPLIYRQYVPDRVDIGRPQGVRIGYLLPGQRGDKVRAVFNALSDQIADQLNLPAPLAQAAE